LAGYTCREMYWLLFIVVLIFIEASNVSAVSLFNMFVSFKCLICSLSSLFDCLESVFYERWL